MMNLLNFPIDQFAKLAQIVPNDLVIINQCRREHNKLGFAYQIAFVRLLNRFPTQQLFEIVDEIVSYIALQLRVSATLIESYADRQPTISEHQRTIRDYLRLQRPEGTAFSRLEEFIRDEAGRLAQTSALLAKAEQFLRENGILSPPEDTLKRTISTQRRIARETIFGEVAQRLSPELLAHLDQLLQTGENRQSGLQTIKEPPGQASPGALVRLVQKIETIEEIGILDMNLAWLSNNFQRTLCRHVKRCDVKRLRELEAPFRYTALACFLAQAFGDTVDALVDMFDKLMSKVRTSAQRDVDDHQKTQRQQIRQALSIFETLGTLVLDEAIEDSAVRHSFFSKIGKDDLGAKLQAVHIWLTGKYSNVFNLIRARFAYIRQFSPFLIRAIRLQSESGSYAADILEAVALLREINTGKKRSLPEDVPLAFVPKSVLPYVVVGERVDKQAWECSLLLCLRDAIKAGNLSVSMSKRFGRFDDFFMPEDCWRAEREAFFTQAGLPVQPDEVPRYLSARLNQAFDLFLETLTDNAYVTFNNQGWRLASDAHGVPSADSERMMAPLREWLSDNMRTIKLPDLLIEVDNDLKITRSFMSAVQQESPTVEDVCAILATIMAHGCNIGPYTMSHMTQGVSYYRIKQISDWMLSEESQRAALAIVVNAISKLDVTQAWGVGKTSSSDGQRFAMQRKVLQQTYSPKFNDFALEFYTFVADNYAPFFSLPIECTDRDAPYVLDGLLYNESDLPLEEHFTDTHGYTENNFAAFEMLGMRFSPRIRGLHRQRIYRIGKEKVISQ